MKRLKPILAIILVSMIFIPSISSVPFAQTSPDEPGEDDGNTPELQFYWSSDVFASDVEWKYIDTGDVIYVIQLCPGIAGFCA